MKQLFALAAVGALLVLPLAHNLFSAPQDKVAVCHIPDEEDQAAGEVPHVIIIARPAVDDHVNNHGDCVLEDPDAGTFTAGEACSCAVP